MATASPLDAETAPIRLDRCFGLRLVTTAVRHLDQLTAVASGLVEALGDLAGLRAHASDAGEFAGHHENSRLIADQSMDVGSKVSVDASPPVISRKRMACAILISSESGK